MFCRKCGVKLNEGAAFCPNCGEKIVDTKQIKGTTTKTSYKPNRNRVLFFIINGIVLLGIIGIIITFFIFGNESKSHNKNDSEKTEEDHDYFTDEEVIDEEEPTISNPANSSAYESEASKASEVNEEIQEIHEDTAIHRYELIVGDVTWSEAYNACVNRGGYLAHINTQEEFDFITNQIQDENKKNIIFWLGASRPENDNNYHWIDLETGEYLEESINQNSSYYSFWLAGEPSLQGTDANGLVMEERFIYMFYRNAEDRFFWNDSPENLTAISDQYKGRIGYICEYED